MKNTDGTPGGTSETGTSEPGGVGGLKDRLLQAARSIESDDRVPLGFEARVLRELRRGSRGIDGIPMEAGMVLWARGLWRALVPAVSCLVVVGALQLRHRMGTDLSAPSVGTAAIGDREAEEWVLLDVLEADLGDVE